MYVIFLNGYTAVHRVISIERVLNNDSLGNPNQSDVILVLRILLEMFILRKYWTTLHPTISVTIKMCLL